MFARVIIIVLDSVGIGALPDAYLYGDCGAHTIGNIARLQGGLFLPELEKLGLGCIDDIAGVKNVESPLASFGKMAELSKGKDTTSGHWELAGCPVLSALPVFENGFPDEMIDPFVRYLGKGILGNKVASGTQIIAELGEAHMKTGSPIVYTSADSVFQIAAHEDIIPLASLYDMCRFVREHICIGKYAVGRVIARPFIGIPGEFTRTSNRHDFSLTPFQDTLLDMLKVSGYSVVGVGKIADIFAGRGITQSYPTKSNDNGMQLLHELLTQHTQTGLIMANLVEFDSSYGHRNDAKGYAVALERFDRQLSGIIAALNMDDLLIITADHGCDPTIAGTDHTREYVPILAYHSQGSGIPLGIRTTFSDVAATVAENFGLSPMPYGKSFLREI